MLVGLFLCALERFQHRGGDLPDSKKRHEHPPLLPGPVQSLQTNWLGACWMVADAQKRLSPESRFWAPK